MGYDRMESSKFASSEEEDITGQLTNSMQEALQSDSAPRWCSNFWANDEVRVNDSSRLGKSRLRLDIEIVQHQRGRRPKLRFEAKRLIGNDGAREYLGPKGLGCFLDGGYAKEDSIVGMLGYIQNGTTDSHATSIWRAPQKLFQML